MAGYKDKIEDLLEKSAHILYRNPLKVIFINAVILLVFGIQIFSLQVDTSSEGILKTDTPDFEIYNEFRNEFGKSSAIIIGINTSDIFDKDFLTKLKSLHEELENEVPHIKQLTSLINVRNIYGEEDMLHVGELLEGFPGEEIDFESIKEKAINNNFYKNFILSEDGKMTSIVLELDSIITETGQVDTTSGEGDSDSTSSHYFSSKENKLVVSKVLNITKRYNSDNFEVYLSGEPVITQISNDTCIRDIFAIVIIGTPFVLLLVFFLFRRISGCVLPLIPTYGSLIMSLGLMSFSGTHITTNTVGLIDILLAVSVADGIHILSIFYREFHKGMSKEDAIAYTIKHSGLPVVMTSITTAIGLASFACNNLLVISDMGYYGAFGVFMAWVFTIILYPSIIAVVPLKNNLGTKIEKHEKNFDNILLWFANFSTKYVKTIIAVSLIITVCFSTGIQKLGYTFDLRSWIPENNPIHKSTDVIDKSFKGTYIINGVVDSGKEEGMHNPELLNILEEEINEMENMSINTIPVGKIFSINDMIKESNKALNWNRNDFYKIPQDSNTIAQELLLVEIEGSEDLEKLVDSQHRKANLFIKFPATDIILIEDFVKEITDSFQEALDQHATFHLTGLIALLAKSVPASLDYMTNSYIAAFLIITVLMIILTGDLKLGLICMIPNIIPIFIVWGTMGYLGEKLDLVTSVMGCLAIGISVDDTIHFIHSFRRLYLRTGNVNESIKETFLGTGRAMFITTAIIVTVFLTILVSYNRPYHIFAYFSSMAVTIALLCDFVLLPALLKILYSEQIEYADNDLIPDECAVLNQ